MKNLAPALLAAAIMLQEPTEQEPFTFRTVTFDMPTFDRLKELQRRLESRIRRDTSNTEVLKYLLHTHPEAQEAFGGV
ncbi:hypothetical protein [Rhodanobacter sp. PCA2]|uniref:hypothetical protein n=1 Tax=Rhodanobacter sp. PCA2 TaxID=2006117 RepID=UPI0015E645E8|nr:hypothetical protein [Rhodanobacter sp. PCA2]MBA2078572.1 hypothetical protein [Rhodanobacter sp. PCA2]